MLWTNNRRAFEVNTSAVQVGYRFAAPGHWSEPEETLEEHKDSQPAINPVDPEIPTEFVNKAGASCGNLTVKFSSTPTIPFRYSVDPADLPGLLRVLASCAK